VVYAPTITQRKRASTARTQWTIHGERLVDENPHVRLSVASVELLDGKQFEQYMFRMRRCAMTVVLDEPGERLLLISGGIGSSSISGIGRYQASTSIPVRTAWQAAAQAKSA
jgi:hypothetical protein